MSYLAEPPVMRTVDPIADTRLATFTSVASPEDDPEADEIVEDLHAGRTDPMTVRAAESRTGELLGLCAFHPHPMRREPERERDIMLGVIATSAHVRGMKVRENGASLGQLLLVDALRQIEQIWGKDEMPPVWGTVHAENRRVRRLCQRYGFVPLLDVYELLLRKYGIAAP